MRVRWERAPAPLVVALGLVAAAAFLGGGASTRSLPWIGGAGGVGAAGRAPARGLPAGWRAVVPLAALGLWCGLSVAWSNLPDRSWDYANRTLVYAALAVLGLFLRERTRELALGLAAVLGAIAAFALAAKAVPAL